MISHSKQLHIGSSYKSPPPSSVTLLGGDGKDGQWEGNNLQEVVGPGCPGLNIVSHIQEPENMTLFGREVSE